ncbi:MAG: hypothetical protein WAO80_01860, partial [Caldicoprobacterales bacterium]
MIEMFWEFHKRPDYENQYITQINREPAHYPWGAYENADQARKGEGSKFILSLDGEWDFMLVDNPKNLPEGFNKSDADLTK